MGAQVRLIEGRALVTPPKKGVPDSGSWTEMTTRQEQTWLRAQNDTFSAKKRRKALRFLAHAAFLRNRKRSVGYIRDFYKNKLRQDRGQSTATTKWAREPRRTQDTSYILTTINRVVKRGGKRSLSEFLEAEKPWTVKTVMYLVVLLKDIKRYNDRLEKGKVWDEQWLVFFISLT
jgi:hypothetical protein